jgi:predicted  nucleic acid-binding Zn-ribbon protein
MSKTEPPGPKDSLVLQDAVKLLTDEIQLQKELMSLQNAQLGDCRQQLEARAEDLHRARQEAVLHYGLYQRQVEALREAAGQRAQLERQGEELRQEVEGLRRELGQTRGELGQAHGELGQARVALNLALGELSKDRAELTVARRNLNTRFWRYSRPLRRLLGLFDPKG